MRGDRHRHQSRAAGAGRTRPFRQLPRRRLYWLRYLRQEASASQGHTRRCRETGDGSGHSYPQADSGRMPGVCQEKGDSGKCGKGTSPPAIEFCLPANPSVPEGGGVSCGGRSHPGRLRLYLHDRSGELRRSSGNQHSYGGGDGDPPPRFGSVGAAGGAGGAIAYPPRRPCHFAPTCKESEQTCVVVVVEGLPADPSGACSACSVASRNAGKHTCVSVSPDAVCYLNSAWCDPARQSFPTTVRETLWHKMPHLRNGARSRSAPPLLKSGQGRPSLKLYGQFCLRASERRSAIQPVSPPSRRAKPVRSGPDEKGLRQPVVV